MTINQGTLPLPRASTTPALAPLPYYIDFSRHGRTTRTNILVQAVERATGKTYDVDITVLTEESLLRYLRSTGGDNPLAENIVGVLLDHGNLHSRGEQRPNSYAWNKPDGYSRRAVEAFLREAEGKAKRDVNSGALTTFLDRQGTIQWLRGLLNLKPTEMGNANDESTKR